MAIGDGIVDLGALRERREDEDAPERILGHAFYANDANISLDAAGCVTIEYFFRNNRREYDPVTVTVPVGIFMELAGLAPQVMEEVQQRMRQAKEQAEQRGSKPASMEGARAMRDGA